MFKDKLQACTLLITLFVLFINPLSIKANNCTSAEFSVPVTSSFWRIVFVFNCFPITSPNPIFPASFSAQPTKYNEIDLSPNVYTSVPISQLCPFKYLIKLDLSFNSILSLASVFKDLACLTGLKTISFANNLISSPILASDFDNTFAAQIESLNLTNNQIPYVQTLAFIKGDGTSRFPSLTYLGLANNKLIALDLLWPLSLPSQVLVIDMKLNPITNLTNELKLTYNNEIFRYPMINNRTLDATTNSLQYLDDSNMVQYGLFSELDLRDFLYKISNYDLRQSNFVRTFICYCPPGAGLLTVYWFKLISSFVDRTRPIYQLYCSGYEQLVYVFDFPCSFTTPYTGPSTTTYSTLSSLSIPNFTTAGFANQLADNQTTTTTRATTVTPGSLTSDINTNYFYLFFLFIPFFFILFLIFICCIGRCCQVRTYNWCNLICCPCFRPHDQSKFTGKYYDATICYSRFDETWLDEIFIPEITHYENNYKLHKLNMFSRSSDKVGKDNERVLRASKRIIIIFTVDFIDDDFKNKIFINLLREIKNDPNCVIIAINKNLERKAFKYWVSYLKSPYDYRNPDRTGSRSCFTVLKSRIKYNCGLREVETLNLRSGNFWKKFFYLMPFIDYDNTKPAIITRQADSSRKYDDFKLPKLQTKPESEARMVKDIRNRDQLSYASDSRNSKNLRHVIIPIPEFMRTSLGFNKKNRPQIEDNTNPIKFSSTSRTNIFNVHQQETQKNVFSTIPLSTTTPDPATTRIFSTQTQNTKISNYKDRGVMALQSNYYENKVSTVDEQSIQMKNYLPNNRDLAFINRPNRSESPDILALFAPQPNTVISMKKKSKRRSKSSKNDNEYPDNDLDYEMDA